jgi:hypothetical protein
MENSRENIEKINFLEHYQRKIRQSLETQDEKSQERVSNNGICMKKC